MAPSVPCQHVLPDLLALGGMTEDAESVSFDTLGLQGQTFVTNWVQEGADDVDLAQANVALSSHDIGSFEIVFVRDSHVAVLVWAGGLLLPVPVKVHLTTTCEKTIKKKREHQNPAQETPDSGPNLQISFCVDGR